MSSRRRKKDTIGKIEYLVMLPIVGYFIHAAIQLLLTSVTNEDWSIYPYIAFGILIIFSSSLALRLIYRGQKKKELPQWYFILILIVSSIELLVGLNMFLLPLFIGH